MSTEPTEVVTPSGVTGVVTTSAPAAAVDRTATTAYDPYAGRRRATYRLIQAVYLVFGVIEALIAIRLVLRLLDANANAGFAQFISVLPRRWSHLSRDCSVIRKRVAASSSSTPSSHWWCTHSSPGY